MYKTVKNLLAIAAAEVGYREKETNQNLDQKTAPNDGPGNFTKYSRDLAAAGYYQASKQGFQWCDIFVDWCFFTLCGRNKAAAEEMECQTGLYGAGVNWSAEYYKRQGRYGTSPQAGDQIFFGNYAHTGLVEKVVDGFVYTIEGNCSNQVKRRKFHLNDSYIKGYGHPKYETEPEPEQKPEPQPEPVHTERRFYTLGDLKADEGARTYYLPTVQKLLDKGALAGKEGTGDNLVLDCGEDFLRLLVLLDRQGIWDK